jgi:sarcosine oxidase, subunit beta
VEVVVVGAGVSGLAAAFFLAEAGARVHVVERTGVAAGASGVQPGGVRQQWSTRVSCLLARESLAFYRQLDERLGLDVDARFDPCGYLFLAHGSDRLADLRVDVALQRDLGIPSRIVSAAEAAELVPGLDVSSVLGGAWCGEDGYFDRPKEVVDAFRFAATERGAALEIVEVRRLERTGSRWRVDIGARTLEADALVVAAGCDSVQLVAPLGASLPIEAEARHLFLSEPVAEPLLRPLVVSAERRFAAKQLADGRVLASDLGPTRDDEERLRNVRDRIDELLPHVSGIDFPVVRSGVYDLTPDRQPIVSQVEEDLWVSAGFSGHGFMVAPAVARRLAGAILGAPADALLEVLGLGRFERDRLDGERSVV